MRMSLNSPVGAVTLLNREREVEAIEGARASERKRMILPLHKEPASLLQRMLNAVQPGSYIRPHRHAVDRAESIVVLKGAIRFLVFDDHGGVFQSLEIRAGTSTFGIDFDGEIWHSFLALEPDTVLFEVKPGPYNAETDKEFAPWAPEEFSPEAETYLQKLTTSS